MPIYDSDQRALAKRVESEATKSQWLDWRWHIKNSVRTLDAFQRLVGIEFSEQERDVLQKTTEHFPMSVTPYYLSLIEPEDFRNDPVFMQACPSAGELDIGPHERKDPLHEDKDSPAPGLTHRYPDRVLFHVSNLCSMYCRHCTRKRKVGDVDGIPSKKNLEAALEYIRKTPQVRDVLLSGGDPFMLSNEKLDWILDQVTSIPHVEVVRIGSRMPVVLPYRITDNLLHVLKKYKNLWLNTHFNHPRELTESARNALAKLAEAGLPLGNQTVLLAGVNDCPRIMRALNHKLVRNRVRPYYLYQCDLSEGLRHFRTPIGKGIEILESLRGHTSGFAVPTYVVDAPGGGGKIPVMPNYIVSWGVNKVVLRNYEGVITTYYEPSNYQRPHCDRECEKCKLTLKDQPAEERSVGIMKLLSDWDATTSLTPGETERLLRRQQDEE